MQQIWIPKPGPPEVLELRQAPDPQPEAGEIRIRVVAAGVNFADIVGRLGIYPDLPPMPVVVGYEVAGRVDELGAGVDPDFEQRVMEITDGAGVELVLDAVGGKSFKKSFGYWPPTGRLGMFGISSAATGKTRSRLSFLKMAPSVPWFQFTLLLDQSLRQVWLSRLG